MTAPVEVKAISLGDKKAVEAFIDVPWVLGMANEKNWVPPLKDEVHGLIMPGRNPWFEHGEAQLYLAEQGGRVVGRISAHIDHLALGQPADKGMGPGTGNWGLLEAEDEATAEALIAQARAAR